MEDEKRTNNLFQGERKSPTQIVSDYNNGGKIIDQESIGILDNEKN